MPARSPVVVTMTRCCAEYPTGSLPMYAVVRRYAGAAALADALIQHEAEVSAVLRTVSGFTAYYALRSANDSVVTMTICESQAGTQESSRRAAAWVRNNLTGLSIGPPEITEGETFLNL